ncbi:venom carboxylesterase-6-like [Ctenocephalides felis]|uniref:venom carboxylesterase-6-like n=1 Tax=Ctenocephalides felis TaxID=7515 RepID=UPI000E6E439B|nr:venom carboxylesterase-6-like [Ctenocephalides felis]
MGIPYAKPPTGHRRFLAPQEYKDRLKRHYKHLGSMCMQKSNGVIEGSEDCLFLNVYTPFHLKKKQKQCRKKYPVMFWIHGGSFNTGSGDYNLYGPDYLVRQGVILVTFNYRLGVLGFLSNPDWGIKGNMGLQDQIMALKWVNENIEAFGGDKNRITIFGESAGAASVHYLMMDNSTEKLYQRAILQSGSLLNPWARQFNTTQRFRDLQNLTNLSKDNKNTIEAKKLVTAAVDKVPNEVDNIHGTNPVFNPIFQTYMTWEKREDSIRDFVKDMWLGVSHTDDLGYLFAMSQEYNIGWYTLRIYSEIPKEAQETHKKMITLWTNFAKTGKKRPKPPYGDISEITWNPFNIKDPKYLDMANEGFNMKNFEEQQRMEPWNELHAEYHRYILDLEEKRKLKEKK